jgi:glycosyltransferase involved in cell wall biosynthesis
MMPTLSIIIPCYNYAHYLKESVESIFNQSYDDFELVLIDDGSTDESWQIMQNYAAKYPQKVRTLRHEENQGLFKANEVGWHEARGTYLHFFSADDIYQPLCLTKVMRMFHANPGLALVCTDLSYFQDGKEPIIKKSLDGCFKERIFSRPEMIPLFQTTKFWIPGLTCIVRQDILKKYGHLDSRLENISDWFCFHKIALFEGIGYIPEILISMRLHDQTYTSRVKRDKYRKRATYYYLLKMLTHNPEIKNAFKQSGLLSFIFHELYWKLRLNPCYYDYWPYIKRREKIQN